MHGIVSPVILHRDDLSMKSCLLLGTRGPILLPMSWSLERNIYQINLSRGPVLACLSIPGSVEEFSKARYDGREPYLSLSMNGRVKYRCRCPFEISHIPLEDAETRYLIANNAEIHHHEHATEYYYVLNGSGTLLLNEKEYGITKGDLIKIPQRTRHQARGGKEGLEILVIAVPPTKSDVCY